MKIKLSNHSKKRIRERTNLNHKERRQLFRLAMLHGKCVQQIKDEKIHNYLASKQKFNSRVRLYQGYVFIYSKNSHQLYTMYKLPSELLESKGE
jgi:hypothetical protein